MTEFDFKLPEGPMFELVKTSYTGTDVLALLQDVRGKVPVLDTEEREKLNQSGVHYSEMLPVEYAPSEEYLKLYWETLISQGMETAQSVVNLAEKIVLKQGLNNIVLVSLARAGTPVGVLLKRYLKYAHNVSVPHYTISIIRGKGIDQAALRTILRFHDASSIVFVDGWVGKGAINRVLKEAIEDFANPEILKLKHYFVSLDLNENEITDPNFTNHLAWLARVAYPLNQFLNYAVDESKD